MTEGNITQGSDTKERTACFQVNTSQPPCFGANISKHGWSSGYINNNQPGSCQCPNVHRLSQQTNIRSVILPCGRKPHPKPHCTPKTIRYLISHLETHRHTNIQVQESNMSNCCGNSRSAKRASHPVWPYSCKTIYRQQNFGNCLCIFGLVGAGFLLVLAEDLKSFVDLRLQGVGGLQ